MGGSTLRTPILSAVICTRDRAELLRLTLESLCRQTLAQDTFEVVIVDDGSTDATREVCRGFEARLPLRYSHQRAAGVATARNHGVFLARGAIVLFFDDDLADPALLEEHLGTHRRFPEPRYGVLGQTRLHPSLAGDPLMRFVAEAGCYPPFSSRAAIAGTLLGFGHFSAGRSSCKRSFLLDHGMFDPVFRLAGEDIELAYRLSRSGFMLVANPRAASMTLRTVTVDEFCDRQYREGQASFLSSRLHPTEEVESWTRVAGAAEAWPGLEPAYGGMLRSARELDRLVRARVEERLPVGELDIAFLHRSYAAVFRASRIRGIVDASAGASGGARAQEATG